MRTFTTAEMMKMQGDMDGHNRSDEQVASFRVILWFGETGPFPSSWPQCVT